jgi:hypothetical protein
MLSTYLFRDARWDFYEEFFKHGPKLGIWVSATDAVRARIQYKIAVFVYRCINGCAPSYLRDYHRVGATRGSNEASDQDWRSLPF